MKKILIVVLLVFLCVSIIDVAVLAKVKFGNWDKWDKELPPADHERWYWAISSNEPREVFLKGWGKDGSDILLFFSDIYFYGDKKGKTKVSVLFYSSGDVDKKDWDIPNAHFALAGFPPEKHKIIIRLYKMQDKIFEFLDQWEIAFKNHEVVDSEDKKFRHLFTEWLQENMRSDMTIPEDMLNGFLPELRIWGKKKAFSIINFQPKDKKK